MTSTGVDDELIEAVREAVKSVTAKCDRQYYLDKARTGEAPTEMYEAMVAAGLFALGVPEDLGGSGGGIVATACVMEEMSRAGLPPMLFSLTCFSRSSILRYGTKSQIRDHVIPTMTGERFFSFAFTEAGAGSNSYRMQTVATQKTDGSYVIRGSKVFISGADQADHMLVAARTSGFDPVNKSQGLSLFIVNASTPGISMLPMNIDWCAPERQFTVFFDDVEVPATALLGPEGQGGRVMFESLNAERVVISAWALGLGYRALQLAVDYCKKRAPWGSPIGSYQGVAHPLARAQAHLDAARSIAYRAAVSIDSGVFAGSDANVAKLLASEAADAAVDAAIQAHGGAGFDADTDIITLWPMVRVLRVAPLNNEMVLNYIAEHMLGLPRSY